jgi:NarL family two-component system response regulator YdfI
VEERLPSIVLRAFANLINAHAPKIRKKAEPLGISDATVKAHITNLLSKLQVSSQTEAIAVAIKRGLVRMI